MRGVFIFLGVSLCVLSGVWKRTVIRVYQQWENPSLQGILLGTVPGKASTKSGPPDQFFGVGVLWLHPETGPVHAKSNHGQQTSTMVSARKTRHL
ncbi:hypothetical protein NFI96_010917, partial [Prochilodus magdalenae]